jgi:hypothetical protein
MPNQVAMTATLMCSFGVAPSQLVVLPKNRVMAQSQFAATIMDYIPLVNIMPFGMCMSMANPVVAAATAAKLGVFSPMPCIPATTAPWIVGSPTVQIGNEIALNNTSKCMCMWAGVISVVNPTALTVNEP